MITVIGVGVWQVATRVHFHGNVCTNGYPQPDTGTAALAMRYKPQATFQRAVGSRLKLQPTALMRYSALGDTMPFDLQLTTILQGSLADLLSMGQSNACP